MTEPRESGAALARRHAAGAPSARGLLLTLLGELVLPADAPAWTSAVITAFGRLGVGEKATRQALMRTAAAGWLVAQKSGRRTRWQLTDSARTLLSEGAERIYSFAGPAPAWDGRWLVVLARAPETDRRARHVLRTRLSWAGFGSLGSGLWISPHTEREPEAVQVLRGAGAAQDAHVFVAARSGLADVRVMVGSAWNLSELDQLYGRFLARFADPDPSDVLAGQIELVHAWRRFPALDPALPRELLPSGWSGDAAARVFAERHQRWAGGARDEWRRLNDPS